jgi:single-stranded-DNA-specific exonuclease
VVGERHVKLVLRHAGRRFHAMRFGSPDTLAATIIAVYRLDVNEYLGAESLQLTVDHWERAAPFSG